MKRGGPTSRTASSPVKRRSTRPAVAGIDRRHRRGASDFQNGVAVKLSRHHVRPPGAAIGADHLGQFASQRGPNNPMQRGLGNPYPRGLDNPTQRGPSDPPQWCQSSPARFCQSSPQPIPPRGRPISARHRARDRSGHRGAHGRALGRCSKRIVELRRVVAACAPLCASKRLRPHGVRATVHSVFQSAPLPPKKVMNSETRGIFRIPI
jgi:hypothetical protein